MLRGKVSPLLLFLFFSAYAFSQNTEENFVLTEESPAVITEPAQSSFFVIVRVVLTLALAAGAIYGLVFLIKKLSRPQYQSDPFLKVLAGASLGANRFVHIIGVGEKAWLIGSTDNGIKLISEISDKDTIDALLLEESKRDTERSKATGFNQLMRRVLRSDASPEEPPKAEHVRKTRERLRGL